MGDIAQILADTAAGIPPPTIASGVAASAVPPKAIKMTGMSKEVMDLLVGSNQDPVSASLPPIVPAFNRPIAASTTTSLSKERSQHPQNKMADGSDPKVKVGTKWISRAKRARPWTWAPFSSSSRTDGATFRHWVRAGVEYTDYPYAKFDIHLDPVVYSEEEYRAHLQSDTWTQSETDKLMELARTFELRWPVIHDRWYDFFCCSHDVPPPNSPSGDSVHLNPLTTTTITTATQSSSSRKIEDLQHRYYGVAATLAQVRISQEAAKEVQSLAAAATASAATAASSKAKGTIAGPTGGVATLAETTTFLSKNKTEATLLETAAARALATSAGKHQPLIANVGTGSTNKMFDVVHERERRHQLDRMWNRSKEEEAEEMELRRELKLIDAQLRKLKKSGGHIVAASSSAAAASAVSGASGPVGILTSLASTGPGGRIPSAASSRNPSRSVSPLPGSTMAGRVAVGGGFVANPSIADDPAILDQSFASTAPVPVPQTPYLQSGRLAPPATGGSAGLNKALLKRMDQVLGELNIPSRPVPTKRVCDVYDTVRKDILTLLTLQKLVLQREGQLQSKRVKLSKLAVSTLVPEDKVLDEERLLGIAPPAPKQHVQTVTPGVSTTSKAKPTKKKGATGGGTVNSKPSKKIPSTGPVVAASSSEAASTKTRSDGKDGVTPAGAAATVAAKKKTVKRKRKIDTTKSPTPASAVTKATGSASGPAAMPSTSASVPAGPQSLAPSKKTSTVPAPIVIASSLSKTSKTAASATTTMTVTSAKNETVLASSSHSVTTSTSDAAKQTGGAKKRARKS